jgi:methionyl-tRNA formyltransferase
VNGDRPAVSRALRVAFLGNDRWSVPSLEALAASGHVLARVVTRVPRPSRRGGRPKATPVAEAARLLELDLVEVETVRSGSGFEALATARPDVEVVVAYGEILPPDVLALPTLVPVNLHFSLLPELRGASPVQTALLRGLEETGVTTMVMEAGLDTGPILLQRRERILPDDDAGTLGDRLAASGAGLLVDTLDRLGGGSLVPAPQDHERATLAPKLRPEDRWLDWREDTHAVVRRVRALSPEPAASARFRGEVLKVFRAEAVDGGGAPGSVALVSKDAFLIAADPGLVRPLEVAPAGRRRMSVADFVRGYHPRPGERLG